MQNTIVHYEGNCQLFTICSFRDRSQLHTTTYIEILDEVERLTAELPVLTQSTFQLWVALIEVSYPDQVVNYSCIRYRLLSELSTNTVLGHRWRLHDVLGVERPRFSSSPWLRRSRMIAGPTLPPLSIIHAFELEFCIESLCVVI